VRLPRPPPHADPGRDRAGTGRHAQAPPA
jgi:hypothetical protein